MDITIILSFVDVSIAGQVSVAALFYSYVFIYVRIYFP